MESWEDELLVSTKPKTKFELGKTITSMKSVEFEIVDVFSKDDKRNLNQVFDKMIRKGAFSVILIREK